MTLATDIEQENVRYNHYKKEWLDDLQSTHHEPCLLMGMIQTFSIILAML